MPENKRNVLPPWPSFLFTLIALVALVTLVRVKSLADTILNKTATENVTVGQSAPSVDGITAIDQSSINIVSSILTPIEGQTNTVTVTATLSDANGCDDISGASAYVYRDDLAYTCDNAQVNCYSSTLAKGNLTGCTGAGDTDAVATFTFPIANFADPTAEADAPYYGHHWAIRVDAADESALSGTRSEQFDVASLAAFNTDNSINYGIVALGGDSDVKTVTFANTGNRRVDTSVLAGGDMTSNLSNFANIAASAVHYSLTPAFTYGTDDAAVDKSTAQTFAIHLPQQTLDYGAGNQPTVTTYWRLRMPTSGVNGQYTNTLTLTAVKY